VYPKSSPLEAEEEKMEFVQLEPEFRTEYRKETKIHSSHGHGLKETDSMVKFSQRELQAILVLNLHNQKKE
jgi:hypothetical protein